MDIANLSMYFIDIVAAGCGYGPWQPRVQRSRNYSLGQCICRAGKSMLTNNC